MTRDEIQKERMRLGAMQAELECKCPHEVYDIDEEVQVYDWRSETWYNCFCQDCHKQWTVYGDDKTFKQVKEEYESRNME